MRWKLTASLLMVLALVFATGCVDRDTGAPGAPYDNDTIGDEIQEEIEEEQTEENIEDRTGDEVDVDY